MSETNAAAVPPGDEPEVMSPRATLEEGLERMPLGFFTLDQGGRVEFANAAALALAAGLTLRAARGRRLRDLFPEMSPASLDAAFSAISSGHIVESEMYFTPEDRWVSVLGCPTSTGAAVFVRDITDQHRAQQQAMELGALVRGSLDAIMDPFAISRPLRDAEGQIVDYDLEYLNRSARGWAGLDDTELSGRRCLELLPALQSTGLFDAFRRVAETGEPLQLTAFPYSDRAAGEHSISGVFDLQSLRFGDRQLTIWRDVTERERSRAERERLASAVDQTPDAVAITGPEGILVYVNRAFAVLLGEDAGALVGRRAAEIAPRVIGRAALEELAREVRGGPWLTEVDVATPDGARRRLLTTVAPMRDPDGSLTAYLTVCRDVTELRAAQARLAHDAQVRAVLIETVTSIGPDSSLREAAQRVCEALVTLPGIDGAAVEAFVGETDVEVIARTAPPMRHPSIPGERIEPERARYLRERAGHGAWAESWEPGAPRHGRTPRGREGLRAAAYGPIVHDHHVDGILNITTADPEFARALLDAMPDVLALTATTSALLAERLHAYRRGIDVRERIEQLLASRAFHPVFQVIVDLGTREAVGYEALTRFDSGDRPDLVFADAWSVGLGAELELATVERAVNAARSALPPGLWIDINVSPRLLVELPGLGEVLSEAGRPVVVEITEHEAVGDYRAVRKAVRGLGRDVRLAVDDAGAGVANFGHIIELKPDLVKLDMSLVRRVNAHLGRQALVIAMRHFARSAGCRLVAEGVETELEAATLEKLGVEFGQGFLFGRPGPMSVDVRKRRRIAPGRGTEA